MFLSLIVYLGTAYMLFILAKNYVVRDSLSIAYYGKGVKYPSFEIILSILLFSIVAGLRYNTGVDHLSYLEDYNFIRQGYPPHHDYEKLFAYFISYFAKSNVHYSIFFGLCAMLQISFTYSFFKDKKALLPYVGLYIMTGPLFLSWMNGIRQGIVCCLFLLMITLAVKRKFILYILIVLLSSLIHKSSLLLAPLYFITYLPIKIFNNKWCLLIILGLSILLGLSPFWISEISNFQMVVERLGYSEYSENFNNIISSENFRQTSFGPGRILLLTLSLYLIYLAPKVLSFYNNKTIDASFILFFIGQCLYNLFLNTSHIFLRPISYFTIFTVVILPATLYYLKRVKQKRQYKLLLLLSCSYIIYVVLKAGLVVGPDSSDLYHFCF